jgi:hypothetical protein
VGEKRRPVQHEFVPGFFHPVGTAHGDSYGSTVFAHRLVLDVEAVRERGSRIVDRPRVVETVAAHTCDDLRGALLADSLFASGQVRHRAAERAVREVVPIRPEVVPAGDGSADR